MHCPDSDSIRSPRRRVCGLPAPRTTLFRFALPLLWLCLSLPAFAKDGPTPVHLRIAGHEVTCKVAPLCVGSEVYVPTEVLAAVGATGKINTKGDAVTITLGPSAQSAELALARPDGRPMLALSDLARLLNADVLRPDQIDKDGKPLVGTPGDTVYLLARVTEARFENGTLRVTTSFPVPFRVRTLRATMPLRSYIDCIGAVVEKDFQPSALSADEKRALRLRAGQNSDEVARVVVELAGKATLHGIEVKDNTRQTILAQLEGGEAPVPSTRPMPVQNPDTPGTPDERTPLGNEAARNPAPVPLDPTSRNQTQSNNVPSSGEAATNENQPAPPVRRPVQKPWRGGQVDRSPIAISALTLTPESDTRVRLEIATGGKVTPFVHYLRDASQIVVDIPHAFLNLTAASDAEQTLTHPLVSALHAEMAQQMPPMARVTLEMTRVVGFTLDTDNGKLTLDLRLPRNASGVLADKLIVVDAGHGGSSKGAVGHGSDGMVMEKNITLAIALKLQTALESCGARVIMTRDRDVDVPLYDRPRMANDAGADLFISIHNDSNGTPNSASGTSTYYHMGDPSSRALAVCVQDAVSAVTGLPSRGALSDGILYASGLAVLRVSKMPAVLCEVAYINNARDRHKLIDPEFQQRVAQAMCDGLRHYVEGMKTVARLPVNEMGQ